MRKGLGLGAVAALLLWLPACTITIDPFFETATEDFTATASFDGVTKLVIEWKQGDVEVTVDNTVTEVTATGEKTARGSDSDEAEERVGEITVEFLTSAVDPGKLTLRVTAPSNSSGLAWDADVMVKLPAGIPVEVENPAGDVTVTKNTATTTVDVGAGDVTVRDNTGDVTVTLGAGDLTVEDVAGMLTLDLTAGDANIEGLVGKLLAELSAGRITAKTSQGDVDVRADDGVLDIEAQPPAGGLVELSANNGRIDLKVPTDFAAALDLDARWGFVDYDLNGFAVTDLEVTSRRVTATLNGGGGTIDVTLQSGQIDFDGL